MRSAPLCKPEQPQEPEQADESFEDLFENAPCGYLTLSPDGRITKANATFSEWIGHGIEDLLGKRLRDFLTVAASIFYETNFAPVLRLQGGFEEVSVELAPRSSK